MTGLRLISPSKRGLKPLVKAALENEKRLMEAGISRTQQRLRSFEEKYHLSTQNFIAQYENDQLQEDMDFIEWIGEFRLLERLYDKFELLKGIRFEN